MSDEKLKSLKAIIIPKDALDLPEGAILPPGELHYVQGEEKEIIWALVQEYRRAFHEAQDVRYFDYKRFAKADELKKKLWALIQGKLL